jgi:LmbE family N-acetylglucosaminyl deacetylase
VNTAVKNRTDRHIRHVSMRKTLAGAPARAFKQKAVKCGRCLISASIVLLLAQTSWTLSPRDVAITPSVSAHALPADRGAAGLWQSLLKLHTRASLIMITAHPDDEDAGMLAYESRGQGARVVLLTLNRGETGANEMSPDYFDALGLVRTEELLAADRYYGVQQYFTRVCDYGFSKSLQEAINEWTVRRVLYDVVRVIRITRPLVVTSVFVGGITDGHGNHQMAGMIAQLAYKEAGDPSVFPDQIAAGLKPWTPLKDYARVPFAMATPKGLYDYADHHFYPVRFRNYVTGQWQPGLLHANVEVPEGQYAPLIGLSYDQLGRIGNGMHKSQNGGTGIPDAGPLMAGYHRFASRIPAEAHEKSFFDGVDTSLEGIADPAEGQNARFLRDGLSHINSLVEQAMNQFSAQDPAKIAPLLAEGLKATDSLLFRVASSNLSAEAEYDVSHELKVKQAQFNTALAEALGLAMQATVAPEHPPTGIFARFFGTPPSFQLAIPGQRFWVSVHVANQSPVRLTINRIWLESPRGENWTLTPQGGTAGTLANDETRDTRFEVDVPDDASYTRPYFTRPNVEQAYWNIVNQRDLNLPLAPYPLSAWAKVEYHGTPVVLAEIVQSVARIVGPGTVLRPLVVGPAISVSISPRAGVVPLNSKSFAATVLVHSNVKGAAHGSVRLDLPSGWRSAPSSARFSTAKDGQDVPVTFQVFPSNLQEKPYTVTAVAEYSGHAYKEGYTTVGYPGLRPYNLYRPSTYLTTGLDVKVASPLNVGYIMGTGDTVPQSLENLGIHVHFITEDDLATGDLQKYDVILLGVRAYAVREDLITYNGRLLNYVKNGGVVVAQYETPEFDHDYGPYPYKMTNDPEEVTDEDSQVRILKPSNPVFVWPNKISEKDFDGWVEERGSKFMESWDPHYEALLSTHDADQAPQKGGLLYARYGKGVYVYCAYAFYRELPEGVRGAYRIFANLISLPRNPRRGQSSNSAAGM